VSGKPPTTVPPFSCHGIGNLFAAKRQQDGWLDHWPTELMTKSSAVVSEKARETVKKDRESERFLSTEPPLAGLFFINSKAQSKLGRLPRSQATRQALTPCRALT